MKILYISSGFSIIQGGATVAIKGLCMALARYNIDITVATTDADIDIKLLEKPARPIEDNAYKIFYFHSPCFKNYGFSPSLISWLKNNIFKFDLVHMHPIFNLSVPNAVSLCQRYNVPYIISPSGMLNSYWSFKKNVFIKKTYYFAFEKRNLNNAKVIHFTSNQELQDAKRLKLKPPAYVIPWGLDISEYDNVSFRNLFRERYGIVENKKIILFLSRIDPKKGLEFLIPALARVFRKRDDFIFVLAGSGEKSYENKIRILLYKNGLLNKTKIVGFVDGKDKISLLRDSDIFVLPSYYENFGYAVVEAMVSGLPVVVSKYIDIHPYILDYKAGIVTDMDVNRINIALEKLLDDEKLRIQMGENGKKLVKEMFAWEKISPKFIELYKKCISS